MHRGDPQRNRCGRKRKRGRRGEGEGAVGGRDPEACEGEDGPGDDHWQKIPTPMDTEEDLVVHDICREPHGLDPPEPDPYAHTRQSCGCFENGWIKSQSPGMFESLDEVEDR